MGMFTWTDARYKKPTCDTEGEYCSQQVIPYGGYAKVVCPDNTEIVEPCYMGYGIFAGKDIYELVVEWNREHLQELFDKMSPGDFGIEFKSIAIIFQNKGQKAAEKAAKQEEGKIPLANEWKRTIGIAIACNPPEPCPYPIKIIRSEKSWKYQELYPSKITQ